MTVTTSGFQVRHLMWQRSLSKDILLPLIVHVGPIAAAQMVRCYMRSPSAEEDIFRKCMKAFGSLFSFLSFSISRDTMERRRARSGRALKKAPSTPPLHCIRTSTSFIPLAGVHPRLLIKLGLAGTDWDWLGIGGSDSCTHWRR